MEGMVRDCFKQHLATGRVIASHFTAKSKAAMNISMTLDFYVFSFSSTRPKFLCSGKMSAKALVSDVFFLSCTCFHCLPSGSFGKPSPYSLGPGGLHAPPSLAL